MEDEEVFMWDYPEPDRARLILRKAREEEEAIEQFEPAEVDDDEMEPLSPLYQYLVRYRMMDEFTNFTSFGVEAIWRLFAPALVADRHRGPKPRPSAMDHLLLYLMWMHTAQNINLVGRPWKVNESRMEDNLNRVRGPLCQVLEEKWWGRRPRPVLANDHPYRRWTYRGRAHNPNVRPRY